MDQTMDEKSETAAETYIADLTRIYDSLQTTGASLQHLLASLEGGVPLAATLSRIIDRLDSIRTTVGQIRHEVPAHEACSTCSYRINSREWTPRFHECLGVCVRSYGAVLERVESEVSMCRERRSEEVYSEKGGRASLGGTTVDGASGCGENGAGFKGVGHFVEKLDTCFTLLRNASRRINKKDSQDLLEVSSVQEAFFELDRYSASLELKVDEQHPDGETWTLPPILRKPLEWAGILADGEQRSSPLEQQEPTPGLTRAKTWPSIFAVSPEEQELKEARKRSAQLDERIKQESAIERNRCSIMLMGESSLCGNDSETNIHFTDGLAMHSTRLKPGALSTVELLEARDAIRRNILAETASLLTMSLGQGSIYPGSVPLVGDIIAPVSELRDAMERPDAVLDETMARSVQDIWALPAFREASSLKGSRESLYDNILFSTLLRASQKGYTPTAMDHHRFSACRRRRPLAGTFSFDFDPISIAVLEPRGLYCGAGNGASKLWKQFWSEATSLVFTIDLAYYGTCDPCTYNSPEPCTYGDLGIGGGADPGRFAHIAAGLVNLANSIAPGSSKAQLSWIIVLMNVGEFREKLKKVPFSSLYKDYRGRDDDPDEVLRYTIDRFAAACRKRPNLELDVYFHVGEPEEKETVKFLLAAVKETKVQMRLREVGILKD